ncbi:extensin-like domain-containing protein [Roseomonas mucosa]|uniref:extensin-like domain-containing protein n=1 Tax=Roseomonas mucosa TaxID=207340 RepID=UPI00223EAC6E|nr:extensin family protein [Roseomonas mucosa]
MAISMRVKRALLLLLLPLALLGAALAGFLRLPPAWDPFAPLDLRAPPNLLGRFKLAQMKWQPDRCFAAFEAAGIPVRRVADQPSGEGCEILEALRLDFGPPMSPAVPVATCAVGASWAIYVNAILQPAAREHLGEEVVRIRQLGTYACRAVRGGRGDGARRSQHATANALDVAGFVLADGREVSLARDWDDPGPRGTFLHAARDGACRVFDAVLGPEYNALHRDHFHLDRGPWRACR